MANSELAKTDEGFPWYGITVRGLRYGVEHSLIEVHGVKYLERWIIYVGDWSLRLHKFWRGDDERAPHDHPFDFWTIPIGRGYWEQLPYPAPWTVNGKVPWHFSTRFVKPWRIHFRLAAFKHVVVGANYDEKPFYTLCVSHYVGRKWGFWKDSETFTYWRDWK